MNDDSTLTVTFPHYTTSSHSFSLYYNFSLRAASYVPSSQESASATSCDQTCCGPSQLQLLTLPPLVTPFRYLPCHFPPPFTPPFPPGGASSSYALSFELLLGLPLGFAR